MNRIGTVIFDLGGVLVDYSIEAAVEAFRRLGFMHFDEMVDPYRQSGILLALEKGEVPPQALYDEISRSVGRPVPSEAIDAALCSFLLDIPDYKLDMLLALRRRGFRLFMLSNTNPIMMGHMKNVVFRKQGLTVDDYFDRLFLSYEMGMAKPDPEIFEAMIRRTGIDPSRSLFIDDSKSNVETARSLGFRTYLAAEHEDFRSLFDDCEPVG
ncbi:HAD family phosphatase [uncultured Alistipes sp.]|uniref:HAD family hydrolase n=1 Tax=uncultured Alistipes sp. TaxID=538949 RepID=UPI0026098C22|nr:HAD family phosphatase [uncultured Alistipes sp.]